MFEKYKHAGKPFTTQIAMELIFKTYEGKPPIDESTITEEVYQIHESYGGLPPDVSEPSPNSRYNNISDVISSRVRSIVRSALSDLKSNGGATREKGFWRIHEPDIHSDEKTYPKKLGKGKQEVYLYYYPAYRENAERERPPVWKKYREDALWHCKIGETHDQDIETRTGQQGRVFPEKKVIALIMKTDDSKRLEKMIQEILKMWNRHVKNADGKEWFLTSPAEVEGIYNFLLHGYAD